MPSYTAQVTAKPSLEPVDAFFFLSFDFKRNQLWLLGGIEKADFLRQAQYYSPGDKVHANYTIREVHEIYNIGLYIGARAEIRTRMRVSSRSVLSALCIPFHHASG